MEGNFWWKRAILYEVYVDKFAKNFQEMAEKLPYLKNLGINCIWLLPHYPSPLVDGGYDVSDFMNVRKELGNLEDFNHFVKKAHRMEIKAIIYYGSEIGMKNSDLPQPSRDSRLYVRRDFDWDEAEQQTKDPDSFLNKVRKIIRKKPIFIRYMHKVRNILQSCSKNSIFNSKF